MAEAPGEDDMPSCYCEEMGDWGYLCCFFDCPGWGDYLDFLTDDVVGDLALNDYIEPPDWDVPDVPNIFEILNDVDQRNPAKPTGDNAPGLDDASFDAEDLKMDAEEIPFREDPTGGFNIVNPLETLPEDGSTAPRPSNEGTDEYVPFPSTGDEVDSENSPPSPNEDILDFPSSPGGTAVPPSTDEYVPFPT